MLELELKLVLIAPWRDLEDSLNRRAGEVAERREYLTLEHLLVAPLEDRRAIDVIRHCEEGTHQLRRDLERFFAENLQRIPER